jgi:proteasome lid subunit RPN8/RPN11
MFLGGAIYEAIFTHYRLGDGIVGLFLHSHPCGSRWLSECVRAIQVRQEQSVQCN